MKEIKLFFIIFLCSISLFSQNIGINTSGAAADPSAILDVSSTNKGALIPRVSLSSTVDVATITSPANYLTVYNTNAAMTNGNGAGMYYYNGAKWVYMDAPSNGPGSSGQVVTSQGSGNAPQWVAPAASGGGGCNGVDWVCVAVSYSTRGAPNTYTNVPSAYTIPSNKEVLIVIESFNGDFAPAPAITDAVSIDQLDYQWTANNYTPTLVFYSPRVSGIIPIVGTADYVVIHGHKNSAAAGTPVALTNEAANLMNGHILIDGTGAISATDATNARAFVLYIFER